MTHANNIAELLEVGGAGDLAIGAPGRETQTFAGLRDQVRDVVAALNGFGFGRTDRVAIVLPNGPEAAVAFLGVAAGATAAPLNPLYQLEEFEYYFRDLRARAVVVLSGIESPARIAASKLQIPILDLVPTRNGLAGHFTLSANVSGAPERGGFGESKDEALVLHTSGTTSRPKIVPLLHSNLCASVNNIQNTLRLIPNDRCLNIMPLFHIHGLIASVLASVGTGGSVFCCPPFSGRGFFGWMAEACPTWYTAVPSMHQIILSRSSEQGSLIDANPLRFIRSSSSPLAPNIMSELEAVFHAPVIESYGMTEATHQMASNPLPPAIRKPGTVGIPAGPEVSIMDELGGLLEQGEPGEIVIRGSNVTVGYENNPEANTAAYQEGWFRTGDQGRFDEDGYLTITGRLKEIINRGGEKISPREIDEVFLKHSNVEQVVTFAIPDEILGEEVACAIVLREESATSADDLRKFASTRLIKFKVPKQFVFLDEIPKGPTGKLQRIGLAEKLGLV